MLLSRSLVLEELIILMMAMMMIVLFLLDGKYLEEIFRVIEEFRRIRKSIEEMFTIKKTIKVISTVIQKLIRENKINEYVNKFVTKIRNTFSIIFYDNRDHDWILI